MVLKRAILSTLLAASPAIMCGQLMANVHCHHDSTTSVSDAEDQFRKVRDYCENVRDSYGQNAQFPISVACSHTHTSWEKTVEPIVLNINQTMTTHASTKSGTFATQASTFNEVASDSSQCVVARQYRHGTEGSVSISVPTCADINYTYIAQKCSEAVAKQMESSPKELVRTIDTCANYR